MARSAASRTQDAAAALLTWLGERHDTKPTVSAPTPADERVERGMGQDGDDARTSGGVARPSRPRATHRSSDDGRPAVAPAHTDWLFHHLQVEGTAEPMAAFRAAASGAGIIPWHLDLDRVEEDVFLRLAAPAGQARTLSSDGARMLAAELRDAVARRHALAVARVGCSQACALDLHALVPVPGDILRLGPDHPEALLWLWTHWGTTDALRHVALMPEPNVELPAAADTVFRVSFWSADWTPWRALAHVRARFPALRLDVQPRYDLA